MKHNYFIFLRIVLTVMVYTTITNQGLAQNFTEVQGTPFHGVSISSIAFADVDGDGDQDVLMTGSGLDSNGPTTTSRLYLNDGTGTFTEVTNTPFVNVRDGAIAFADVNNDGDQDVLITGYNHDVNFSNRTSVLYSNDGSGTFTEVTGTPFRGSGGDGVQWGSIAFADVTGNGAQDVLITGFGFGGERTARLYTNDGAGNFTFVSTPFEGIYLGSIAFADIDGDNDQDVLITGAGSSYKAISKLFINNGTGTFTEVTGTPFDPVHRSSIAFEDIDADGDKDVLITGKSSSGRISKLYSNDGNGNFTLVTGTIFEGVDNSSIAFADIDGDNDQDVVITGLSDSGRISKLYTNNGEGVFVEVLGTPFMGVNEGSIAFADVDGDNDPELLITGWADSGDKIAKLYNNDNANALAISDFAIEGFKIYPNPVKDQLTITGKNMIVNEINIYDHTSRIMKKVIWQGTSTSLNHLATGMYILRIKTNQGTTARKILKI